MPTPLPEELHSALYFGDQRDFWWNADFVALLAKRLRLPSNPRVLDAGCGVGHWSRVLLPHLPDAHLTGVDREPRWVEEATGRTRAAGLSDRAQYVVGDVNTLRFPADSFDLVTCQTVLIHVPDVVHVLREFLRVLRPGGLVLLAEPNNLANSMGVGAHRHDEAIERRLDLVRFQMFIERGKTALGEGDNSLGETLPALVKQAGFGSIRAWQSDRAPLVLPPYDAPDQRAFVDDIIDLHEKGHCGWSRTDAHRFAIAGGCTEAEFERLWAIGRDALAEDVAAIRGGTFSGVFGVPQFLVVATKPDVPDRA